MYPSIYIFSCFVNCAVDLYTLTVTPVGATQHLFCTVLHPFILYTFKILLQCLFISKEDLVLISHCENSLDWVSMVSFRWAKCLKRWTLCKIFQEVELYILDRCWGNLSTINYLIRHQWQQPVDVGDPPASLTHSQTSLFGLWNALLTEVDLMVVPMMAVFSIWYDDCVVWYRVIYRLTDSGMHHFCFR